MLILDRRILDKNWGCNLNCLWHCQEPGHVKAGPSEPEGGHLPPPYFGRSVYHSPTRGGGADLFLTPQIFRHSDGPAKEVVATTQYLGPLSIMAQWSKIFFEVIFQQIIFSGFGETTFLYSFLFLNFHSVATQNFLMFQFTNNFVFTSKTLSDIKLGCFIYGSTKLKRKGQFSPKGKKSFSFLIR